MAKKKYSSKFKAKVALAASKGRRPPARQPQDLEFIPVR